MGYMYPFPRGARKSQPFGANPSNGTNPAGGHTGDDWAVPVGTPVHAAGDGIIRHSSWFSANYLENPWWLTRMGGDTLVLDCGDTAPTFVYAHLSDSAANVGDRVRRGQVIGYSGNSGTATTGPHCHMECLPPAWNMTNGTYGRVNPAAFLTDYPGEITVQGAVAAKETPEVTPEQMLELKKFFQAEINKSIEAMWSTEAVTQALIQSVAAGINGIKAGAVDLDALARAVNDDAAKRMAR